MDIKQRNKEFLNRIEVDNALRNIRDSLVDSQHPETLVITCSDSRVIPEYIFSSTLGELFVIRTAGNVINEGELASIEYAIEHLQVKHIIVLGHTQCGAIHASIRNESGRYLDPILKRIKHNIGDISNEIEASRENANKEALYIKSKFPRYQGNVESLIYNIKTSEVD